MGSRGPKPGFKRARAEAKAAAAVALANAAREVFRPTGQLLLTGPRLTVAQQSNPALLGGEQLKALAHRLGMARSSMAAMSDTKIREQLRFLTQRRYEEAA